MHELNAIIGFGEHIVCAISLMQFLSEKHQIRFEFILFIVYIINFFFYPDVCLDIMNTFTLNWPYKTLTMQL